MKLTFRDKRIAVYDEFLPIDNFERLWLQVQTEQYKSPARSEGWIKVWRLGDGPLLSSREYLLSKRPFNNALDIFVERLVEVARRHSELVGSEDLNWNDITVRSYLYPRGSKLSWHEDSGGYSGAFSYYVHPKWGSTWGGELLVAETDEFSSILAQAPCGPYIDHEWEDRYLLDAGRGTFIAVKPNRLVLTGRNVYHAINRVDADAGDHVRSSVSGFFMTPGD